jgi:hypothetical protein
VHPSGVENGARCIPLRGRRVYPRRAVPGIPTPIFEGVFKRARYPTLPNFEKRLTKVGGMVYNGGERGAVRTALGIAGCGRIGGCQVI